MSRMAAQVASRILRNRNGVYGDLPRIYNVDRDSYSYGYTEINTMASSTFARVKSHKGWFEGEADIEDGDLIVDRADGKHYLVMALKNEVDGGISAYKDGTLYYANTTCNIERFTPGTKDAFGRETVNTPDVVTTGAYIMVQSVTMDVVEQKDQDIAKEKLKVAIQAKYGVLPNDRLVTALGDTYKVMTVDKTQMDNLWMLYVDKDIR